VAAEDLGDWQARFDALASTLKCAVLLARGDAEGREQVDEILRGLRAIYEERARLRTQ